jgi:hypothetical protein
MLRPFLLLVLAAVAVESMVAEEIVIVTCDVLPVVEVRISGLSFHFLVDTAATSMLNINSFAAGETKTVAVTSWSGTVDAKAKQVTLNDLSVGDHHFHNLVLHSVDLSGIGRACGRQIDGVLGIDLLRKVGAVLDLTEHTQRLRIDGETTESVEKKLNERIAGCEEAFNRQDEATVSDCLDPEIVVFSETADFHGRQRLMEFLRERYSSRRLRAQLSVKPFVYRVFGGAIWMEYEFQVNTGEMTAVAQGTALWSNAGGKWRIIHLDMGSRMEKPVAVSNH